jgi:drug/metabolite transporter (DMT)-like permease
MHTPRHIHRANLQGILWMVASMAGFALEDAFIKTVTQQLPVGQVLMLFGAGGAMVFAVLARCRGVPLFNPHVFTKLMLLRAVFEFIGRLFYVLAIAFTPMSSATAILQAAPILVVLGAKVVFREQVDFRIWLAILTGLLGVLVILHPSADDFSILSLLAVTGTVGFVGRDLATRAASAKVTTEVLGFYGFSTMLLAGTCFALWDAKPLIVLTSEHLWTLGAALLAGVSAYTALMTAMRTGSLSAVTPFRYTRLLFGVSIGVLIFGEHPDMPMWVGCAIVIGAGLFIGWQGKRARSSR